MNNKCDLLCAIITMILFVADPKHVGHARAPTFELNLFQIVLENRF